MALFVFINVLIIVFILASTAGWIISWLSHLSMSKDYGVGYGYGDFKTFKKYFDAVPNKTVDTCYHISIEGTDKSLKYPTQLMRIHANYFRFEGKNMMFINPIEYIRVSWFCYRYVAENKKKKLLHKF